MTGGTRGIGQSIAARLREAGAEVIVTGTHLSGAAPEGCSYFGVDFADPEATERFAVQMAAQEIDILVNNAGINVVAPFAEIVSDDFDRIQRVNVRAPMLLCRAVLARMRARGWGRIVNVSSIFGVISKEQRAAYSASKFALDGMTAALAAEAAGDGVLANCVAPGFIDTELTREVLGQAGMAEMASGVPARRLGRPEEVAELVAWLAGPKNSYVSGQNVVVDGGFTRT